MEGDPNVDVLAKHHLQLGLVQLAYLYADDACVLAERPYVRGTKKDVVPSHNDCDLMAGIPLLVMKLLTRKEGYVILLLTKLNNDFFLFFFFFFGLGVSFLKDFHDNKYLNNYEIKFQVNNAYTLIPGTHVFIMCPYLSWFTCQF